MRTQIGSKRWRIYGWIFRKLEYLRQHSKLKYKEIVSCASFNRKRNGHSAVPIAAKRWERMKIHSKILKCAGPSQALVISQFHGVTFFPRKKVTKEISRNRNPRIQSQPHTPSISVQEYSSNMVSLSVRTEIETLRLNPTPSRTRRFRYSLTNAELTCSESAALCGESDARVKKTAQ